MLKITSTASSPEWVKFRRSMQRLSRDTERINSGQTINNAADSPAGIGIAARYKLSVSVASAIGKNLQNVTSALQAADTGYVEIQDYIGRLEDLANRSKDGYVDNVTRAEYQTEAENLLAKIDNVAAKTTFNSQYLLKGKNGAGAEALTLTTQIGQQGAQSMALSFAPGTASYLGIDSIDMSTYSGATSAATAIETARSKLAEAIATNGSHLNAALNHSEGASAFSESMAASVARISNAKIGETLTNYAGSLVEVKNEIAALAKEYTITKDIVDTVILRQFNVKGGGASSELGSGLKGGDSLTGR